MDALRKLADIFKYAMMPEPLQQWKPTTLPPMQTLHFKPTSMQKVTFTTKAPNQVTEQNVQGCKVQYSAPPRVPNKQEVPPTEKKQAKIGGTCGRH
eukprot:15365183-Ditylum_brightwellii.AAC.3